MNATDRTLLHLAETFEAMLEEDPALDLLFDQTFGDLKDTDDSPATDDEPSQGFAPGASEALIASWEGVA